MLVDDLPCLAQGEFRSFLFTGKDIGANELPHEQLFAILLLDPSGYPVLVPLFHRLGDKFQTLIGFPAFLHGHGLGGSATTKDGEDARNYTCHIPTLALSFFRHNTTAGAVMDRKHWFRFPVYIMGLCSALTGLILMFGPRPHVDLYTRFKPPVIDTSLEEWLAASEAGFAGLRPGLAKEIIWSNPSSPARTSVSIVYIHGFSASKGEVRPVPDEIATRLGANLFYTRLAGHGATGAALGAATAEEWLDDVAEALWIGSQIGERTVVIATSTGATLVAPLLADRKLSGHVAAAVFISPNFGLRGWGTTLLTLPFSGLLADWLLGKERVITPSTPAEAEFWTLRYPARALLPMGALVKAVEALDFGTVRTPAFFYYSKQDRLVDPKATDRVYEAWGGPKATGTPVAMNDPYNHVIAGDALSPSGTGPAVDVLSNWLKTQLNI